MPRKDRTRVLSRESSSGTKSPSRHARAGEALAYLRVIISLFGGGAHEFVKHLQGHIEKLIDPALHKLDFENLRIFLIAYLGDFR